MAPTGIASGRLAPGTQVAGGRFEIVRFLGEGATGAVYEARELDAAGGGAGGRVAIKVLALDPSARAEAYAAFGRDLQALARLKHPNIAPGRLAMQPGGAPALLVMDLLDGEDLQARLRRGLLPVELVARVIAQVGSALVAAHGVGVIHHALKPSNVLLQGEGAGAGGMRCRVLDFGVARLAKRPWTLGPEDAALAQPQYLTPEQVHGTASLDGDANVDQFALATLAYELYSGKQPFAADALPAVLIAVTQREPPSLLEIAPKRASPRVARAIQRAMAKNPGDRYHGVAEFVSDLLGVAVAAPRSAAARAVRAAHRRKAKPGAIAAVALALVLLVGGGGWLAWQAHRDAMESEAAGKLLLEIPDPETLVGVVAAQPSAERVQGGEATGNLKVVDEAFARGINSVGAGDCKRAAAEFEDVLRRDAGNVEAHYYLGVCYAALGKDKEGAFHYEEVLHRRPDDAKSAKLKRILREYYRRSGERPRWPEDLR